MKKDRLPDPSKLKWVKGPMFPREVLERALHPSNVKVRITTYISEDVYRWLKREADRTGTPYQILLNQKLRHVYEEDSSSPLVERVRRLEEKVRKIKAA